MDTLELGRLADEYTDAGRINPGSLLMRPDPQVMNGRFLVRIVFYASRLAGVPVREWGRIHQETIHETDYTLGGLRHSLPREALPVHHHDGSPFTLDQAREVFSEGIRLTNLMSAMRSHRTSWENDMVRVDLKFPPGVPVGVRRRIEGAVRRATEGG